MTKVISILEENKLFDNNPQKIQVNKIADFFNNYKINPTSYNPSPKTIKRNSDGYIMLDVLPYIISDLKTNTRKNSFWMLLDNGSRVFVKKAEDDEMENELLFQELCKILHIPCANYDIAVLNDNKYLISNSFLGINEIVFDYYDLEKSKLKSYVDVDEMLKKAKKINQEQFLRKTLTVDGVVKNVDRFPKNFRTILSRGENKICPLHDNGLRDKARITMPFIGNSASFNNILEYLMQDKEFKNWVKNFILRKKFPDFKDIIFNEKKIYIDSKTYDEFQTNLHEGKLLVKDAYKNS